MSNSAPSTDPAWTTSPWWASVGIPYVLTAATVVLAFFHKTVTPHLSPNILLALSTGLSIVATAAEKWYKTKTHVALIHEQYELQARQEQFALARRELDLRDKIENNAHEKSVYEMMRYPRSVTGVPTTRATNWTSPAVVTTSPPEPVLVPDPGSPEDGGVPVEGQTGPTPA